MKLFVGRFKPGVKPQVSAFDTFVNVIDWDRLWEKAFDVGLFVSTI